MSFHLTSEIDNNKVFFVQRSELEERLDPLFYIAVENIRNNVVKKAKYECIKMLQNCSINRGRFGHRPRNDPRFYGGEYPFIQTGDIVKAADSTSAIEYTQTLNDLGLKTSKIFEPPKLLFTIAANIGDTAILDYPSCFPDSVVALIPKNDDLSLKYLNIYLRLIKPYVVELAPYSAQRNLNNQQLAQIPVVIPPKDVQSQIVARMEAAYSAKKQKESEAQQLLDSIDDYLLGELGIELPEKEKNTVKSRIFTRQLNEVAGCRFDPDYYRNAYKKLESAVESTAFLTSALKDVTALISNGGTPASTDYSNEETPYPIIKVGSYEGDFIVLEKTGHTITKRIRFAEKSDIFVLSAAHQAEYVGRSLKYLENKPRENTSFVGELICIRANKNVCNPMYLFSLLKTPLYKNLLNREKTGQTSHIYPKDIQRIKIPVPPSSKQNEMAQHIIEVRNHARELIQQAKAELEQAKREVEAMILGKDESKA